MEVKGCAAYQEHWRKVHVTRRELEEERKNIQYHAPETIFLYLVCERSDIQKW
jgi:hypothetical protein